MEKLGKLFGSLMNNLLIITLAALCIIVFSNVILRTVFTSLTWTVEVSRFIFVYFIFLSSIIALKEKIHFRVNLLVTRLPATMQTGLEIIGNLLILLALGIILAGSWKLVLINANAHSTVAKIPMPLLYGVGIFTSVVMGVIILMDLARLFRKITLKGRGEI